ncbi:MAG: tyrosine-type recombinase/integrase, partial [Nitrospinaceae bacterium]|nr:tyrosine-type recombinase/integrase [Nitrospinaceae bacterium]
DVIHNYIPKKYIPISLVASYSGLRRSNLCGWNKKKLNPNALRKKDVNFKEGITVIAGRRKKRAVFVPMNDKLKAAFDLVPTPLRPDDLWFPNIEASAWTIGVRRGFHDKGIDFGSPHHFRHAYACWLLNNGVHLKTVSNLLGHAQLSTTEIYARLENKTLMKDVCRVFSTNLTQTG